MRRSLYERGSEAVAASTDPMIMLARSFEREARVLAERYRKEVGEVRLAALERIAAARFRLYGDSVYPDATGTLRLSYGIVDGWTEPTGRKVEPFTYFAGLFERATGSDPYRLAPLWEAARQKLSPDTTSMSPRTTTLSAAIPARLWSTATAMSSASCSTATFIRSAASIFLIRHAIGRSRSRRRPSRRRLQKSMDFRAWSTR